ncbi:MAG: acireductone synthase [Pirellulaceae bacterium]
MLDIEGTTSSISFVHDVMFPFVLQRLDEFLEQNFDQPEVRAACEQIASDANHACDPSSRISIQDEVRRLMKDDVKATGLKALQGLIWHGGFESGELVAHVYPDVIPAIERWKAAGIDVRIYSSGSIAAQRLFFAHLDGHGDCLHLFSGHYDTTIGGKKQSSSYEAIAQDWKLPPADILFVSDIADELIAALGAGLQVRGSLRPGNAPFPRNLDAKLIGSFDEIDVT